MTARWILTDWLTTHGYDGLYESGECACLVGDLAPCDASFLDCKPGYKQPCDDECGVGPCPFHVGAEKVEAER